MEVSLAGHIRAVVVIVSRAMAIFDKGHVFLPQAGVHVISLPRVAHLLAAAEIVVIADLEGLPRLLDGTGDAFLCVAAPVAGLWKCKTGGSGIVVIRGEIRRELLVVLTTVSGA